MSHLISSAVIMLLYTSSYILVLHPHTTVQFYEELKIHDEAENIYTLNNTDDMINLTRVDL